MATFRAPALFTTISTSLYESQINQNFTKIDTSFRTIQTDLAALSGAGQTGAVNNLGYVDELLGVPRAGGGHAGVIGETSFVPTFTQDTDGDWTLVISHPRGESLAVISNVIHRASVDQTYNISALASAAEEQRFVFGVTTAGVPALTPTLEQTDDDTDSPDTASLNVWEFTFLRTTDGQKIVNLQRASPLMPDRELMTSIRSEDEVLEFRLNGVLGASTGLFGLPVILPYDCEIESVAAWLGTLPDVTDQRGLELEVLLNGEEFVHDGRFQWGNETDGDAVETVVTADGLLPTRFQARKNEVLRLNFLDAVAEDVAADLVVQVRVRRLYHEVRRRTD